METIAIGSAGGTAAIKEGLRTRLPSAALVWEEEEGSEFSFLAAGVASESGPDLRDGLADTLAELLLSEWTVGLLERILKTRYRYFTPEERRVILGQAAGEFGSGTARRAEWFGRIAGRFRAYLEEEDHLLVEGFITFRLQDYLEELAGAVERAVDDFLLDREYREFIRLLRYFVDVQEPKHELLHVLFRDQTSFEIFDAAGRPVDPQHWEDLLLETADGEMNYEDLLISALITLAPERLTLHLRADEVSDESVETVRSVFGERAGVCTGCEICRGRLARNGN